MKFTGIYAAPPTLDAPLARIFFDWHDRRRTHSPRLMLDNDHMEALLARVALRDRKAFHELYEVSSSHLLAVALRILHSRAQAEEALQDGFVQIWQNAKGFNPAKARASTWMSAIVRYRALDAVRRHGRESSWDDLADSAASEIPAWHDSTPEPRLQPCLQELGNNPRECVTLAFVEGYSHQELSSRLDTPLGTIKSWIRRGLNQLKECLER